MKVAVIPARGGSKRIPRKNIRNFCGKPMMAWTIEAALRSDCFERVIVSTDDAEIAEIALEYGAEVPFTRPAELADDYAGTTEVIGHATQWMLGQHWSVEAVCCLYAAAPFVQVDDIRRGLDILKSGTWAYVFTATEYAAPIFRSFRLHPEGGIEMFFPQHLTTRSQDLPVAVHDAGQFYWGAPDAWLEQKRIFDRHSYALVIPRWRVQDIDTDDDWRRAEILWDVLYRHQDG